jgi:VanZ family protein
MVTAIFMESSANLGSDHTGLFLRPLWTRLFGVVSDVRWERIHFAIRKSGHFIGYGLLALSWVRVWLRSWSHRYAKRSERWIWACSLALFCTALIASLDEVHQSYIPNRTGMVTDVLLDCSGAALLMLIAAGVTSLRGRYKVAA